MEVQKSPDELKFRSAEIGKWNSRQENPFAEQNRKAKEKREKQAATARYIKPFIVLGTSAAIILILLATIALLIVKVITDYNAIPTIAGGTTEDINSFAETLQTIYEENNNDIAAIQEVVNTAINSTSTGREYENQLKLAQLQVLMDQQEYDAITALANQIDDTNFTNEQKLSYYNILYYTYLMLNDLEAADTYQMRVWEYQALVHPAIVNPTGQEESVEPVEPSAATSSDEGFQDGQ